MSQAPLTRAHILAFLEALETQVLGLDALAQEWQAELSQWPGQAEQDASSRHRFREWFLLERSSPSLGAPPLVALAPAAITDDSPWARLEDAFLGIFQVIGQDEQGFTLFEDLWSGRQVRLDESFSGDASELLLFGYLLHGDGEFHLPFPGCCLLAGAALRDAMAGDLSRIRAEQPGARLSLRSGEELLQAILQPTKPTASTEQALAELLAEYPQWSPGRLRQEVEQQGLAATLDHLAFHSKVDLEALRQLLLNEETDRTAGNHAVEGNTLAAKVEAALHHFDRARAAGKDLNQAMAELEADLELEAGSSGMADDEAFLNDSPGEEDFVNNDAAPELSTWLAMARWEREHLSPPVHQQADPAIEEAWLEHLEQQREEAWHPQEISAAEVLAFLSLASDAAQLQQWHQGLLPFLSWLSTEQEAAIPAWLLTTTPEHQDWQRLISLIHCRQQAASQPHLADAIARVAKTSPLMVHAEAELARVTGLDEESRSLLKPGDYLNGHWQQGEFQALAWMPAAWMPTASEEVGEEPLSGRQ